MDMSRIPIERLNPEQLKAFLDDCNSPSCQVAQQTLYEAEMRYIQACQEMRLVYRVLILLLIFVSILVPISALMHMPDILRFFLLSLLAINVALLFLFAQRYWSAIGQVRSAASRVSSIYISSLTVCKTCAGPPPALGCG